MYAGRFSEIDLGNQNESHLLIQNLKRLIIFINNKQVEIILEQREVAFLSPSKICGNLNFSTVHTQPISVLKYFYFNTC